MSARVTSDLFEPLSEPWRRKKPCFWQGNLTRSQRARWPNPLDDKWPGFLEMVGRSLAGLLLVALFFLAVFNSDTRLVVLKAVLG